MGFVNSKLQLVALATTTALALSLFAAACGGGDDEGDDGGAGAGNGDGAETAFDLSMGESAGNFFELDGEKNPTLTVPAGEEITVNLTNDGAAIHNMRFGGEDKGYNTDDDAASDPALVAAAQTATLTFTAPGEAGTYVYQCDFHPTDMLGEIEVE